jgi:hypothetical protein
VKGIYEEKQRKTRTEKSNQKGICSNTKRQREKEKARDKEEREMKTGIKIKEINVLHKRKCLRMYVLCAIIGDLAKFPNSECEINCVWSTPWLVAL